RLVFWAVDDGNTFALDALYISVFRQHLNGPADGIAGAVKFFDQSVFRRQRSGRRIFFVLDSLPKNLIDAMIFRSGHFLHLALLVYTTLGYHRMKETTTLSR